MVHRHHSTTDQRTLAVCQMIIHAGDYGFVTQLSRKQGVKYSEETRTATGLQVRGHYVPASYPAGEMVSAAVRAGLRIEDM